MIREEDHRTMTDFPLTQHPPSKERKKNSHVRYPYIKQQREVLECENTAALMEGIFQCVLTSLNALF